MAYSEENIKINIFKDIKNCVDSLIPQNNSVNFTEDPSVDIEFIARKNGITDIQYIPPDIFIDRQPLHIKHAILIGNVIFVNEHDNPEKQRFSIAHEIFHYNPEERRFSIAHEIFHSFTRQQEDSSMEVVARQGEAWKKENIGSAEAIEETMADYFAANLLIPTERFILWEDETDEEIARAFRVEAKCIRKRREEIEMELDLMTPKDLSSDVKIEDSPPLTLDELKQILEANSIHDQA
jgi:Zn-dependent peptidase ImmA (M78 family)